MRSLLLVAALAAAPAFADTIEAVQRVTAVTIYSSGASVTREAEFEAKAGLNDVILPFLPQDLDPSTIRVIADGAEVIGTTLMAERLPVVGDRSSPEIDAARAEITRLEGEQRKSDAAIAAIRQRARIAEARIEFLNNLALGGTGGPEVYQLASTEIASLISEMGKAEAEAREAEVARMELDKDVERARQALLVLLNEDLPTVTMVAKIDVEAAGPVKLTILNLTEAAQWSPIYDLRLTRSGTTGTIAMERGVLILQETGEDWSEVALTLSTSSLTDGGAPGMPYALGWELLTEQEWNRLYAPEDDTGNYGGLAPTIVEVPVVEEMPASSLPLVETEGLTLSYTYPVPVSVRTGTDFVRLAMDGANLDAKLTAVAYPTREESALLRVDVINSLAEPILPGLATYYVDGVLVASSEIDEMIVPGDQAEFYFGKIDGVRVHYQSKSDQRAENGVVFTASERKMSETATIRNLTGESWPVEVFLGLDYARHADLTVSRVISPAVAEMDVDGKEGVAKWAFKLEPGAEQVITVEQILSWPDGYILQ